MKQIRHIVRKALLEISSSAYIYPTSDKGKFPYEGKGATLVPQDIDSEADYIWDYSQLSNNNEIYDFPTAEFNLGLKIEKQRNPEFNILSVADKVIFNLKENPRFYSELKNRYQFGAKPVQW